MPWYISGRARTPASQSSQVRYCQDERREDYSMRRPSRGNGGEGAEECVILEIREMRDSLNNQLEAIKHRVGSIERIQIASNADAVAQDVTNTIGSNAVRAYIVSICKEEQSNSRLIDETGMSKQALHYHTKALVDGDLLSAVKVRGEVHFVRNPLCDKIQFDKRFRRMIDEFRAQGNGNGGG